MFAPWVGALSGIVGAAAMLGCVAALPVPTAATPGDALRAIGSALGAPQPLLGGAVAHVAVGIFLGVLHASCIGDGAPKGLIGVAVFYAVVTWVVANVACRAAFGDSLHPLVRSPQWFSAHLAFVAPLAWASQTPS